MTSRRCLAPRTICLVLVAACGLSLAGPVFAQPSHLELTEVLVLERAPQHGIYFGSPFIEIANPTTSDFDLSDVYLATTQDISLDKFYWNVVRGMGVGGGTSGNFHCRFPDGMTIAAGDTIVIALTGSADYQLNFGRLPDLELFEDGLQPDQIPDMREVVTGSIGAGLGNAGSNTPALSASFDSIVLYTWDGNSDLVQDLDYLIYGTDTRVRVDKTGVSIDGIDADEVPSTYLADTPIASQHPALGAAPTFGHSLKRLTFDETGEIMSGGNGITGHDETSEDLAASWQDSPAPDPAQAPATFYRTAPIVTASSASNPAYAGQPVMFSATVLGYDTVSDVEFHYAINGGDEQTLAATSGASNAWSAQLDGLAVEDTVAWYLTATSSNGAVAVSPVGGAAHAHVFGVIEAPQPGEGPAKLYITEVCTTPSAGEFVEIYNANAFDVPLHDYYLTDAIYAPSSEFYWRIVEGNPSASTIGGDDQYGDFHARFPAGAVLKAGDKITIAILGSGNFESQYGILPDYELFEDQPAGDQIPNMDEVFPGSIGTPSAQYGELTNYNPDTGNGELVVLYYWDGLSDLVTDIDVVIWGNASSYHFTKNLLSIDGIDPDTIPSQYGPETAISQQGNIMFAHAVGESYQRLTDTGEGNQTIGDGNGVDGRDELSENWNATFEAAEVSPDPPAVAEGGGSSIVLAVPSRTFLPYLGETFPIEFVSKPASETKLRLFDLDGRLVITLFDSTFDGRPSTFPENPSRVIWDGRNKDFELVRAGVYVAHLSVVDSETGDEETKTAPVVVATRLQK